MQQNNSVARQSRANQLCRQFQCRLFVNDHWQLAIEAGCYGVHLGQEDIQQADLAQIQRARVAFGHVHTRFL